MTATYENVLKIAKRQLFPDEVRTQIPALYSQEHITNKKAVARFFTPDSNWTWYVIEGSPVDNEGIMQQDVNDDTVDFLFFGLVYGFEKEYGYFSLSELVEARGPMGMAIERDIVFQPTSVETL